jgi:hypothetical protein
VTGTLSPLAECARGVRCRTHNHRCCGAAIADAKICLRREGAV